MILLTGATGFVGGALLNELVNRGANVLVASRQNTLQLPDSVKQYPNQKLAADTDWSLSLEDASVVIHLAARVHVMKDSAKDPLIEFRKINVEGTLNLARQAAAASVKRFIFISSIKVNGESTIPGLPFEADGRPNPLDPYSISKWETETGLHQLAKETGMEVVIIRPPMVYGPRVKANFLRMLRWVDRTLPLPLGAIHNKRSLVAIDNLIDLIITCIDHPAAANQIFLAGDGEDLSTTELLQRIGNILGKKAWLIPLPVGLLMFVASLMGMKGMAERLCGSLQVDISKARKLLGWVPPISVDEGLRRAVESYKR